MAANVVGDHAIAGIEQCSIDSGNPRSSFRDRDQWLEKAYRERDPILFWLEAGPPIEPLRSDPRFSALLERVRASAR